MDQQLWQQRIEPAIQRNASQIQTLKYVVQDFVRRSPGEREIRLWEQTLRLIEPLDLQAFLNQPTKKGR
ncbi:MAG: hypothetical protein AAF215_27875 [Cyanobacteria bacterium P01_A01_bin.123]